MARPSDRWRRISELFDGAAGQPAERRGAWLAAACQGDADLLREVESLLAEPASEATMGLAQAAGVLDATPVALVPGQRLGNYEVLAPLGAGGMGEVYRARDLRLRREVAIKTLPRAFTADPDRRARFEREARVLAALSHPNIATIHGFEESGGVSALVMELVEGDTLAERISRTGRGLPVAQAMEIARQIAEALDAAHGKGVVHRDLKPANVKITPDGVVKVLDFGLAKLQPGDGNPVVADASTITVEGTRLILGTAGYMSPEQARGLPVDKRTDIWAFGCVLYEMLTGCQTFGGEGVSDTVAAVLTREPDWSTLRPSIPPHLRRLLERCLQKDPRQRLRDIADARTDLAPERAENDATASGAQSTSRLPWIAAALATFVAIVAVAWGVRSLGADTGPTPLEFSRMTAITRGAAHEFGPVISPNSTWVAYVSDVGGRPDVWLKFLGGSEAVNLTAASGLDISASTAIGGLEVAPDGKRIAVQAKPQGSTSTFATWEIPTPLPGVARQLLDNGFLGMRWSLDGNRMAFIRAGSTAGDAIWVADGDGTNRRELVAANGGLHMHWLTWSGDGLIYFMRPTMTGFNLDQSEIYRVDPAGGAPMPVVSTLRRAMFPLLDRGGALIYAADPTGTDVGLWWKPPGDGAARRLTFGLGDYMEPRVSADGRAVVATRYDNRQLLVRIDATGTQFGRVTPLTDGYGGDLDPSMARGGRLVFSSTRDGNRHLWTADADGRNVRPLTSGPAQDHRPAMSPDGTTVAFISDRGGQRGIWLIAASGGAPRKLVDAVPVSGLAWSRSGTEIVYAAAAGAWPGLWSVSIADGTSRRISTPNVPGEPQWSPTRDLIAYLETATTGPAFIGLAFVTPDGAPQYVDQPRAPNISTGFSNGMLAWSPDGRRLVITSQTTNAATSVWIAEPGAPTPFRKLLDLPVGPRIRGLTWTRDGTAIIVGQYDASGDIVLLERELKEY